MEIIIWIAIALLAFAVIMVSREFFGWLFKINEILTELRTITRELKNVKANSNTRFPVSKTGSA